MIPQKQETAVQQQVVVDVPIEQAFKVFIEKFDLIKPREHNLLAWISRKQSLKQKWAEAFTTAVSMAAYAVSHACSRMNRLIGSCSVGTLTPNGRSKRT